MRVLWIGGSHPRHFFFINTIGAEFHLVGSIIVDRGEMQPQPPAGLPSMDRDNFIRHFRNRDDAESRYFDCQERPDCPILTVAPESLNSAESASFVRKIKPDAVLVFGPGMIRDPLLTALPPQTLNMHLGLSPRYRGAATLFWPFFFLEPAFSGSTFHYLASQPDTGDIVHQAVPMLDPEDHIHDVACKTVIQSSQDALRLLRVLRDKGVLESKKQTSSGKNFLSSDFIPQHLRMIYNVYDDDIVRQYLDGKLPGKQPKLFRQF